MGHSTVRTGEISSPSWIKAINQEQQLTHAVPWILAENGLVGKGQIYTAGHTNKPSEQSEERSLARALSLLGEQRCSKSS